MEYVLRLARVIGISGDFSRSDEVVPVEELLRKECSGAWCDEWIDRAMVIEREVTNHDVKAVEMVVTEMLQKVANLGYHYASRMVPFVHFGLTSQDITSVALWLQLREARRLISEDVGDLCQALSDSFARCDQPMLSRTHGQPATPTTFGKEIAVFIERLEYLRDGLLSIVIATKFGGATGGLNAHALAYPNVDWPEFAKIFLKGAFRMERLTFTTQIDHYDRMAELFDACKRICTVVIDFCRDMWLYISQEYLLQKPHDANEVGSSTMPHKINPIKFENAEGNLMLAVSLFEFLARKLPISRLQRDLTDSTVSRNLGLAMGYMQLGLRNCLAGVRSVTVNREKMESDLSGCWNIVTEGLQTLLRASGDRDAYDTMKHFIQQCGGNLSRKDVKKFVEQMKADGRLDGEFLHRAEFLTPSLYKTAMTDENY